MWLEPYVRDGVVGDLQQKNRDIIVSHGQADIMRITVEETLILEKQAMLCTKPRGWTYLLSHVE